MWWSFSHEWSTYGVSWCRRHSGLDRHEPVDQRHVSLHSVHSVSQRWISVSQSREQTQFSVGSRRQCSVTCQQSVTLTYQCSQVDYAYIMLIALVNTVDEFEDETNYASEKLAFETVTVLVAQNVIQYVTQRLCLQDCVCKILQVSFKICTINCTLLLTQRMCGICS